MWTWQRAKPRLDLLISVIFLIGARVAQILGATIGTPPITTCKAPEPFRSIDKLSIRVV